MREKKNMYLYSAVVLPFVVAVGIFAYANFKQVEIADIEYKMLFSDNYSFKHCNSYTVVCIDNKSDSIEFFKNKEPSADQKCGLQIGLYDVVEGKIKRFNITEEQCKSLKLKDNFTIAGLDNYKLLTDWKSPDGFRYRKENFLMDKHIVEKEYKRYLINSKLIENEDADSRYNKSLHFIGWLKEVK